MALTADRATRIAPVALAAVVVAGAFAVGAYLAPVGDVATREFTPAVPADAADPADFEKNWPRAEWRELAPKLVSINHLAGPTAGESDADSEATTPDGPSEPEPVRDATPILAGDFKMLGAITAGDRVVGLVETGGNQRFVGPGDVIGNYEVVRVAVDHIIVSQNGREQKLELQSRDASSLRADQRYLQDRDRLQQAQEERMRALRDRRAQQREPGNDVDRQP